MWFTTINEYPTEIGTEVAPGSSFSRSTPGIGYVRRRGSRPRRRLRTHRQRNATRHRPRAGGGTGRGYATPVSFSELRRRVGTRDSGQFNYHLDRLRGTFVRETDSGYELRYPGALLYRTIAAGFFTSRAEVDPFETGSTCFDCGATLRAEYGDGTLEVGCPDCGREYQGTDFPPSGATHRSGEELLYAFDQYVRHQLLLLTRGICYWCTGQMAPEIQRRTDPGLSSDGGEIVFITRTCEHCGGFLFTLPGESVLYHPAVVSFFHGRGVDVTERPLWELEFISDPTRTTVHEEEPWRIGVTIACDGDEMEVVVDGTGEVVEE